MRAVVVAVMLIGTGGLAAGVVGVLLPAGHRVAALLALVAGAGVGVITLATSLPNGPDDRLFLLGSALGLATVLTVLALAWRRAHG